MRRTVDLTVNVCLDCQIRLRYSRPSSGAILSSRQNALRFHSAATKRSPNLVTFETTEHQRPPRWKKSFIETTSQLDQHALGEVSELFILRESMLSKKPSRFVTESPSTPPSMDQFSPDQLLSQVNNESALLAAEEIWQNIEGLRPTGPYNTLSRPSFERLADRIAGGFTLSQLKAYLRRWKQAKEIIRHGIRGRPSDGSLVRETKPWEPSIGHSDDPLTATFPENQTSSKVLERRKIAFAAQIIRRIWGVEIEGESIQLGEAEIQVSLLHASMLLMPNRPFLKHFATQHGAEIDVIRSKGLVRITAKKDTYRAISRDIGSALRNVRCMKVNVRILQDLRTAPKERLSNEFLSSVSHLTGTHMEMAQDRENVYIHYFGPTNTDAEDARRLILSSIRRPLKIRKILVQHASRDESQKLFLCPVARNLDMAWIDQRMQYSRLSSGIEGSSDIATTFSSHDLRPPISGPKEQKSVDLFLDELTLDTARYDSRMIEGEQSRSDKLSDDDSTCSWAKTARICEFATFGITLLDTPDQDAITPVEDSDKKLLEQIQWKFWTVIPKMDGILQRLRQTSDDIRRKFTINLVPSPWKPDGSEASIHAPDLKIEVEVSRPGETRTLTLSDVHAVIGVRDAGLIRPHRSADIKFTKVKELPLINPSLNEGIVKFLDESNLNISGQDMLRTPAITIIDIPEWTLREAESEPGLGEKKISMEYALSSLEYTETIELDFEGWDILFSTVEAGKTGGRRKEIRMARKRRELPCNLPRDQYESPEQSRSEALEEADSGIPSFAEFSETACRFADKIERASSGAEIMPRATTTTIRT